MAELDAVGGIRAGGVLMKTAELATLRGGVLGYYHTRTLLTTSYMHGDAVAIGQPFRLWDVRDQVCLADRTDNRIRVYGDFDEVRINVHDEERLPIPVDVHNGDALTVGQFKAFAPGTNTYHGRVEIALAWGGTHAGAEGRVTVYQYDGREDIWAFVTVSQDTIFESGDVLDSGEVWSNPAAHPTDEIFVAHRGGRVRAYSTLGEPWMAMANVVAPFGEGDGFACGHLLGNVHVQLAIADHSADTIRIYDDDPSTGAAIPDYVEQYTVAATIDHDDPIAIGDVLGDQDEEIVLVRRAANRMFVYGYSATSGSFVEKASMPVDIGDRDALAVGHVVSRGKADIMILRGGDGGVYPRGTVEILGPLGGETPGDRYALDALINPGGAWAGRMASDWTSEGYLLLVGEVDVIPAFRHAWTLLHDDEYHVVRVTDRDYADTAGNANVPELAVGRILGNSTDHIAAALDTAIALAEGTCHFRNNSAFVVSGYRRGPSGRSDDIDYDSRRMAIAGMLRDRGFFALETGTEQAAPVSVSNFFPMAVGHDVIHLEGHGNWSLWDILHRDDVLGRFTPDATRPLVTGASCLTGYYPPGTGFAESWLIRGAAAYVGATDLSYASYDTPLIQKFYEPMTPGNTLGWLLKQAKRDRALVGNYDEEDMNMFCAAIYHLYGDPKIALEARGGARAWVARTQTVPHLDGPLSELQLTLPPFTVVSTNGTDHVRIPGQTAVTVPGQPVVPSYTAHVRFPPDCHVQNVALTTRDGLVTTNGLHLPAYVPTISGRRAHLHTAAGAGHDWWPPRDFDWNVDETPDGGTTLLVTLFPFYYNTNTTEVMYYRNYVLAVDYEYSPICIHSLVTDKHVYDCGETVAADMYLHGTNGEPVDVIVDASVLANGTRPVEHLPLLLLEDLQGWVHGDLTWDSTGQRPGTYVLAVEVRDTGDTVLDRIVTEFELGGIDGWICDVSFDPAAFRQGDDVGLSATFENTGSAAVDGIVTILIEDATGNRIAEFEQGFSNLTAGASFVFSTRWANVPLVPRNCRTLAYAQFGNRTTALSVGADWREAPLLWDVVQPEDGNRVLRWPSVAGRTYAIDFQTNLQATFLPLVHGVSATPPQNCHTDRASHVRGFYRLREQW